MRARDCSCRNFLWSAMQRHPPMGKSFSTRSICHCAIDLRLRGILGGRAAWGMRFACSGPSPGNLCSLLGFVVVGPLSSIITVSVVSWLITYFLLQTKRFVLAGVFLFLLAGGYYSSKYLYGNLMRQSLVYRYRLQSGNLDDLRRYSRSQTRRGSDNASSLLSTPGAREPVCG